MDMSHMTHVMSHVAYRKGPLLLMSKSTRLSGSLSLFNGDWKCPEK